MRVCRLSVAPLTPLATQQTRRAQTRRVPGITGRSTMHAACDTALRRRATAGACRTFMHFAMQEGGGSQRGWGLSAGDIPFQEDTGHLVRVLRLWPGTAPSCAGRKHWIALHPARTPLLGLHLTISWASSTLSLSLSCPLSAPALRTALLAAPSFFGPVRAAQRMERAKVCPEKSK